MSDIIHEAHEWLTKLKMHRNFQQHVTTVEPLRTDMPGFNLVTDMLTELSTLRTQLEQANTEIERTKFVFEFLPENIKKLMWKAKQSDALNHQLSVAREALITISEWNNTTAADYAREALKEMEGV